MMHIYFRNILTLLITTLVIFYLPLIIIRVILPIILLFSVVNILTRSFKFAFGLFAKGSPELQDASRQVIEVDAQVIE